MPDDFTAKTTDEYFIAIANQSAGKLLHSFVMLGVVINGQPTLLTRVAKSFRPGDNTWLLPGRIVPGELKDEFFERPEQHIDEIHYSAHAISYEQTLHFLAFLDTVNDKQARERAQEDKGHFAVLMSKIPDQNHLSAIPFGKFNKGYVRVKNEKMGINKLFYVDKRASGIGEKVVTELTCSDDQLQQYDDLNISSQTPVPLAGEALQAIIDINRLIPFNDAEWYKKNAIFAYKPKETASDGTVTFEYTSKPIVEGLGQTSGEEDEKQIYRRAQEFTYSNTCRHTAVDLVKLATANPKAPHNVSSQFFSKLPIKTTLVAGKLTLPFFILPPPPKTNGKNKNNEDMLRTERILKKLYHRMEKLSTEKSEKALEKFNLIKSIYNKHAGKDNVSADEIIASIAEWISSPEIKKPLCELREKYFIDRFVERKSATKKMFEEIQEMASQSPSKK